MSRFLLGFVVYGAPARQKPGTFPGPAHDGVSTYQYGSRGNYRDMVAIWSSARWAEDGCVPLRPESLVTGADWDERIRRFASENDLVLDAEPQWLLTASSD